MSDAEVLRNPKLLSKAVRSVELGTATTPRSLYRTALGIFLAEKDKQSAEEGGVYLKTKDRGAYIILQMFSGENYDEVGIINEPGCSEVWICRRSVSPKGRERFQMWWQPPNIYSEIADSDELMPDNGYVRIDRTIKSEQILKVNRNVLAAYRRTLAGPVA